MDVSDPPDAVSDDAGLSSLHDVSSVSLVCDPCQEDGHSYEAKGYCVDCTHYLCTACFKHHHTPRPMRHHTLLDEQQMLQTKPVKVFRDECTDKCSVHGDEILKYFCEDHEVFGCTVCVTLEHRTCKVVYIPTLAADLFNAQEYISFKLALESMIRNSNSIQVNADQNLEDTNGRVEMELVKIRKFRKGIDNLFDELENKTSSRLTQLRDDNQEALAEVIKKNVIMADNLKKIEKDIKEKEAKLQKCRLFVDMKQLAETIRELKKDIDTIEKDNKIKEMTFIQSAILTNIIRNKSEILGSLVSFHESYALDITNIVVQDIAVLSRERIAILCLKSQQSPYCILIIVTKQTPSKVVTTMIMPACTRGLTRVGENEISVAQKGKIYIYSATDKIVLKKTILNKSTGLNDPIGYGNGVLVGRTRSSPYRLRIVNMDGDVIKTFPMQIGKECNSPCYIAVNPDQTAMYVSDGVKKSVTCLTFEGEVQGEYTPGSEWDPRGVAVSSEELVYVSDSNSDNIHVLTYDLKPHDVIIGTRYGIRGPRGLAVCDRERKLYVGSHRGKTISVFNV